MGIYKKVYLIFLLFSGLNTEAQIAAKFRSVGMMMGYGHQLNNITPYNPIFLSADLVSQFKPGTKKIFVCYYLEPQFNLVVTDGPTEIEFGSNIGLRFYQYINKKFYLYQMIGSGPHYITAELQRQAKGFIFSDNIALGFFKKVTDKTALNFQIKLRHISNAGLKRPNAGVNTLNILIGLSKLNKAG